MKFSGYALNDNLVSSLNSLGYYDLTLIQEKTIVPALKGKSFIAKAETGSGKTHAFLIPIIQNLTIDNNIQAIIVEPTLELCYQIDKFIKDLSSLIKTFDGYNLSSSILKKGENLTFNTPTIIVSTPNKLLEAIYNYKCLNLANVKTIVLDEADMLLEGESSQEVISLMDSLNVKQKMVFTATMKEHQIVSLKKLFAISQVIEANKNFTSTNVKHHFVDIKHRALDDALITFINTEHPYFTLVFASRKNTLAKIYSSLCNKGIRCAYLTSDESLRERKNTLKRIQNGEFELVLCSDLASRGLDFEKVSHVISLDIPSNIDYYYHRSGRTGRYNNKGDSYIFYDDELNLKAKQTLEKKLSFDYLILRQEGLKQDKKHLKQPKKKNEKLEAEIKKELAKVRSNKVKPNYKKKMRKAVNKAIKNHKRKIIMENLKSKRKAMAYKD